MAPSTTPTSSDNKSDQQTAVMFTYGERALTLTRGKGAWVWDDNNQAYLDAVAGIAVCNLGHANPQVAEAIYDQAQQLIHCSNLYRTPLQQQLAEKLCAIAGMDKVFFSNSGAEANEAAIKIARKYGNARNVTTPTIVVMENSFHGRTMATLSATGNEKVRAGFEPLVEGFIRVPFNDIDAVRALSDNSNVVAVLVEPVQGEGGVHAAGDDYLQQLRSLCDQNQWLLMLDEIQTGNGRTGSYFAYQQYGIAPDVVTTAKGLGNGLPIGACLARGEAASVLQPGNHGSTFGGNPLACRAALTVVDIISTDAFLQRVQTLGNQLTERLAEELENLPSVKAIRSKGLMLGIELDRDCGEIVALALEQHLLVNVTAGNTVRLLPPLNITDEELNQIADGVIAVIQQFLS